MLTTREDVHHLVDQLDDDQLVAAARALRRLQASPRRPSIEEVFAGAPPDDEPLTDVERQAIAEARADIAAGRIVSDEEIRREFRLR